MSLPPVSPWERLHSRLAVILPSAPGELRGFVMASPRGGICCPSVDGGPSAPANTAASRSEYRHCCCIISSSFRISGPHDKRLSVEPAQSLGGIGASRLRDDFGDSFTYHHLARQSPGHRGCLCAFFVTENREQTIFPTTYLLASKAPEVSAEPQGAPWGSLIIGGCTPGRPEDYSGEAQARSGQ